MLGGSASLLQDVRGAIMILALFVGLLLVGALYYVIGVGDAVLYRGVMQDGADAGAFAASVMAAKGMNLHSLLNVVMAVTAGVLLVIRSVEVLFEIVLGILKGLATSVVLAPKALPLIAVLTPVEATVEKIGDGMEQFVRVAHDALDVAHHAVQRGYPLLSEARGIDSMAFQEEYDPPVAAGFVVPVLGPKLPSGGRGLPVEEGDVGTYCDRAADGLANRLANVKTRVPKWVLKFLGGVVKSALRLGKRRTCKDEVLRPPRIVLVGRGDESEVWLGHEEFQYRAYAIGRDPHRGNWETGERGIRLAQGGAESGRNSVYEAHVVGRLAFAQSEFYFDGMEDKSEWLWKQRWRARLRRFRISRAWIPRGVLGACAGARGRSATSGLSGLCDLVRDFSINAVSAH